jgi:glutamine amidotransferase
VKIALIDYGAGNLSSVANALRALDIDPQVAADPASLEGATHMVLPGVGSFGDCMAQLGKRGLLEPIRDWLAASRPYLGICLGYQILFDLSEESPGVKGLGVVPGTVRRFTPLAGQKIPHMGWNSAVPCHPESPTWVGLGAEPYFYYVHSYFPVPEDAAVIAAETRYGGDTFAAAIERPNLLACQFHPEKSQHAGLRLLRNWIHGSPTSSQ